MVGEAELGVFAQRQPDRDVASLSPMLRVGMRPRPEVELFGSFGAVTVFSNGRQGRQQSARPANLGFGAAWVHDDRSGKHLLARVGFGFSLPTGFATSGSELDAYTYALGGRAGWNPWEWTPSTLGLFVPASVQAQVSRRWVLGAEGALAGMLASTGQTKRPALAAQVAAQARFVLRWFALGVRASGVWNGRHPSDRSQAAISPFVDASLCRRSAKRRVQGELSPASSQCPVYATARMNFNLDGPYGLVPANAMRLWGLQLGLGWAVF